MIEIAWNLMACLGVGVTFLALVAIVVVGIAWRNDLNKNLEKPPHHSNCRCTAVPVCNKDLDDPQPTLDDLDPDLDAILRGFSRRRPVSREEREAGEAELEAMRELCLEADERDLLVMELGDDVLKGYTPRNDI